MKTDDGSVAAVAGADGEEPRPGARATIRDVARLAGTSVATVSAVINGTKPVREPLRRRVEAAVAELRYQPNLIARALQTRRTRTMALLVPSLANPFFAGMAETIEAAAHRHGYSVFVASGQGDPAKVTAHLDRLLALGIDGVLAATSWDIVTADVVGRLKSSGVPVVGVGGSRTVEEMDCFLGDDEAAGELAARYLLGLGHRRLAYLGGRDSHASALRYRGFTRVLQAHGAAPVPELVIEAEGHNEAGAAAATCGLIARGAGFTALVTYNDAAAVGALGTLQAQGLTVPGRVSLMGFGDSASAYASPKLTTIASPVAELGERGVARLLARIGGVDDPPTHHRLPVTLVVRESTRAPHP